MSERLTSAADESELRRLRERAYGPGGGLEDDPAALARLAELEAAHLGIAAQPGAGPREAASTGPVDMPGPASPASGVMDAAPAVRASPPAAAARRRAAALTRPRTLLVAGVVTVAVAVAIAEVVAPQPDATLRPTSRPPGTPVNGIPEEGFELNIRWQTMHAFEEFRGIQPWGAEDRYGNPCLVLMDPASDRFVEAVCTPPEGDLIADVVSWSDGAYGGDLPSGSVIRFHHRGDFVEVRLYPAE